MNNSESLLIDFGFASQNCERWAGVDDEMFSLAFSVWDKLYSELLKTYSAKELDEFAAARRHYRNAHR